MKHGFLLAVCVSMLISAGCGMRSKEQLRQIEQIKRKAIEDPGSINMIEPSSGLTLLHLAVLNGFPDLVEWLLDRKADINGPNRSGETPLHAAMIFDHTPKSTMVTLLLERGADVNSRTPYGDTPLHRAVSAGRADKARLLLSHEADVNARANRGESPLHYVCREGSERIQNTVKQEDLEHSVKVLLQFHADIDTKDSIGATPLHGAVMIGNEDMVRCLIEQGADIKATNQRGDTPLHYAAMFGRSREAEMLLANGCSAVATYNEGMTPLDIAQFKPAISYDSKGNHPVDVTEVMVVLRTYAAKEEPNR
ncbi:MAG: ankyrin repeat domain-containing protein [Spartobacteria bacterium]